MTDLTLLPQTSVPTHLVEETHLTELEATQAHLLREATNRLVATIHQLNHTFLVLLFDQLPKMKRLATEKPKVDPTDVWKNRGD